jgi:hypothetical protein
MTEFIGALPGDEGYEAAVEIVSDMLMPAMTPEMDVILEDWVDECVKSLLAVKR